MEKRPTDLAGESTSVLSHGDPEKILGKQTCREKVRLPAVRTLFPEIKLILSIYPITFSDTWPPCSFNQYTLYTEENHACNPLGYICFFKGKQDG
jgi:hypothetical protein